MGSVYGKNIKVSIFGQSHSAAIGVVIDGLPAGHRLDIDRLNAFLKRRSPAHNPLGTQRKEEDSVEILAGLYNGCLCGAPFAAIIRNTDTKPSDYSEISDKPRPGHADYTAQIKYGGFQDATGGGHFSGRLTAPLCIAGGICMQLLENEGINIGSHIERMGSIWDSRFDPVCVNPSDLENVLHNDFPVINKAAAKKMIQLVEEVRSLGDSVGGVIECAVTGLPEGLGDPMFDGLENKISSAVFAIPAVKGIEFGNGFEGASLLGSENNDSFTVQNGKISTLTNNHGGILGGISSGMPLIFRAAFKPTPSIAKTQQTVSLSQMKETELTVHGRHDPCIVIRAVPCVEAAASIAIYDTLIEHKKI